LFLQPEIDTKENIKKIDTKKIIALFLIKTS
jgi:hypothetical protein